MTKLRAPLTIDAALARIAGQLPGGWDEMAEVAGRKTRTVRNWGDPDTVEQVPIDCAIDLDLAYLAAGGDGTPIRDAYDARLELAAAAKFSSQRELLRHAEDVIREGGEAHAAILAACQPDATAADRENAHRELAEAFEPIKRALALLGALGAKSSL